MSSLAVALARFFKRAAAKGNPNHDPHNGKFTSGGAGGGLKLVRSAPATDAPWRAKGSGLTHKGEAGWTHADGTPAHPDTVARLKAVGVSPGYRDVRLNTDPAAPMQVVAMDVKGREKRFYSKAALDAGQALKFERNKAFHAARPALLEKLRADAAGPAGKAKEAAAALLLIDKTGFRPGTDENRGTTYTAHGATTLEARHVALGGDGKSVHFDFTGKEGVTIKRTVEDAELHALLAPRVQGKAPTARLFDTSDDALRDHMAARGAGDFLPKDFRTWNGTHKALEAIDALNAAPLPTKDVAKLKKLVATAVAQHLGNTPSVALANYINPLVWDRLHV